MESAPFGDTRDVLVGCQAKIAAGGARRRGRGSSPVRSGPARCLPNSWKRADATTNRTRPRRIEGISTPNVAAVANLQATLHFEQPGATAFGPLSFEIWSARSGCPGRSSRGRCAGQPTMDRLPPPERQMGPAPRGASSRRIYGSAASRDATGHGGAVLGARGRALSVAGGTIAFVLPFAALNAPAFGGLRRGVLNTSTRVRIVERLEYRPRCGRLWPHRGRESVHRPACCSADESRPGLCRAKFSASREPCRAGTQQKPRRTVRIAPRLQPWPRITNAGGRLALPGTLSSRVPRSCRNTCSWWSARPRTARRQSRHAARAR